MTISVRPGLSALAFMNPQGLFYSQTRRAAGMDARRFPTEAGCRVGKSREDSLAEFALSGKRFSLVRFFWRFPKEMNPRAAGVRKLLLSSQIRR